MAKPLIDAALAPFSPQLHHSFLPGFPAHQQKAPATQASIYGKLKELRRILTEP